MLERRTDYVRAMCVLELEINTCAMAAAVAVAVETAMVTDAIVIALNAACIQSWPDRLVKRDSMRGEC